MWLRAEGFIDKFKEWWQSYNFWGKPSFVLAKKLQALKCNLKKWNKEVLGNVSARKDVALEQLNHWDVLERLRPLLEEDRRSQRTARDEYSHFTILEETSWSSLMVKGVQLNKEGELKEGIGSYFKSMFEETQARRPVVV
ncbi:hypothetical protein CK203_096162 [Vitis vinifera]|uniref:Uncharacterized protein n=1 Tax=Vitis vinifera TaxID=29760 RepID=A0A438CZ35_VITVI|nr:hypothetical protein CK203_096162 [Vitis vinifera]